jgi:hypothetical protein
MGRVARNLALRRHRTRARVRHRERVAARPEGVPADDALERLEVQRKVVEAVQSLDEPCTRTRAFRQEGVAPLHMQHEPLVFDNQRPCISLAGFVWSETQRGEMQ